VAVGRIGGQLLKQNLLRQGVNLAFETDLLYLDVTTQRVGVNNATPLVALDVIGEIKTNNIEVPGYANIADMLFSGSTISTPQNTLTLGTLDTVVYQKKLAIDSIEIENNVISTVDSNSNLELRPSGTGTVEIYADTNVDGNIYATGNITADGNITIGDANTDNLTINAEVASDIIPDVTGIYSLGSDPNTGGKQWQDIWVDNFIAGTVTLGSSIVADGVDLGLRQGNIYYVAENGDDTSTGTHPADPYASVGQALSSAVSGDTIHIYPGIYTETFPLTIPVGVSIKGHSIRNVIIQPTASTNSNDAFLLNGETTVEDITIRNFYYNSVGNTGYAFRFATNATVSTRSPYIRNVTVITEGSTTTLEDPRGFNAGDAGKGVYADGSVLLSTSNEASMLFHSVTFITPGVDTVTATNGVRIEWLNCFTYFANRSVYALDGTLGKYGSGKTILRVSGVNGTFAASETISYYDTDGITVLASGTIDSISGSKIYLTDKGTGEFLDPTTRGGKTVIINGDAQINTATKKYGIGSLQLDGVGDYLSINANDDFGFGTGDFTVETWIYLNDLIDNQQIFDFRSGSVTDISPVVYVANGGQLQYYVYNSSRIIGTSLSSNTWYHIALVRDNGNTRLYVDGSQVGATYTDTNDYGSTKPCTIGARFDGANECNGFFDDFRVIKGQAAYTSNFTAPTLQLTVTAETVLMLRFDTDINDDVIYAQDIRFSGGATATEFTLVDYREFGAEIRMIGSASIYGNYGLYGDGSGIIIYAIGHNLAYIGNGKEVTNDPITVIQTNEITKLNNAKIYYVSVDHKGDFRVGEYFYVNQDTGTISFSSNALDIDVVNEITFNTNGNFTFINGEKIETGNIRISGNTISSLFGNIDINAYSDIVNFYNNVDIDGNLNVTGNVTIGGNLTIGDEAADNLVIAAGIGSSLIPSQDSIFDLGSSTASWKSLFIDEIFVDSIEINTNYIRVVDSNADLELRASGTGNIYVPSNNVVIDNNLTVNGTTNLAIVNISGDLSHVGNYTQTGDTSITGSVNITQQLTVGAAAQFEDIKIDGNVLRTTLSNSNLELIANGSGIIYIPNNDVLIDFDLEVLGTITAEDINVSGDISANRFTTGNIVIDDNFIETTISNSNLELRTSGSGVIEIDDLNFYDYTIQSATDLILDPASEIVTLDSTGSLRLPIGSSGDRPSNATGSIRFNNQLARFEGFDSNDWIQLHGVTDLDGDTKVTAELTQGANDNIIRFIVNNNVIGSIDYNSFDALKIVVDDIILDGNLITTAFNTDLQLDANGTGQVVIDNIAFKDNQITNLSNNQITQFSSTNNGYYKFTGTNGLVIPSGDNTTRITPGLEVLGMVRWNTEQQYTEIWDGTQWISVAGSSGAITYAAAENLAIETVLLLG